MPQVYRRHSDYTPRPSLVPRRRSVVPPPGPQPTDADDSIVLADLVRTGEASRLRRRGAMRLDHAAGAPRPPPPARQSSYAPPPTRPVVIEPSSRTASPDGPFLPEEDGQDEYTYSAGPPAYRDWQPGLRGGVDRRGAEMEILSEGAHVGVAYELFCGGEEGVEEDEWEDRPPRRFQPALFAQCPSQSPAPPARAQTRPKRTNGCGALVHVRAFPQNPRGVWMAKEEATEAVMGLDAAYCDHPAMDKMLRSACGCVREGIGCSVCGNTLGTRYVPCQAASESMFCPSPSPSPSATASTSAAPPRAPRPSGPSYWGARAAAPAHTHRRPSASSRAAPGSYYTFFADRVSASPACDQPAPPGARAAPAAPPTPAAPRAGESRPASPEENDYGYRWTASPAPLSAPLPPDPAPGAQGANPPPPPVPLSPVFAAPPLPPVGRGARPTSLLRPPMAPLRDPRLLGLELQPVYGAGGAGGLGLGLGLDPDGVPLGEDEEPSSPDKETMSWPGR